MVVVNHSGCEITCMLPGTAKQTVCYLQDLDTSSNREYDHKWELRGFFCLIEFISLKQDLKHQPPSCFLLPSTEKIWMTVN